MCAEWVQHGCAVLTLVLTISCLNDVKGVSRFSQDFNFCLCVAYKLLVCVSDNNNWFLYSAFLLWDTTRGALQYIINPGHWINPALIVHLLNSLGSILARCHFRSAHVPHQATNNVCILPGAQLYTWVESSDADKVSCWRTKVPSIESNPQPFDPESRVHFNPIYQAPPHNKCQAQC